MVVRDQKRPIRILHIVGGMNPGGVETWLMHVLRRIDRNRYRFDFLTHTSNPCFYDDEIRSLGCRIIPCLHPSRPWQYAWNFHRILKENGPYDVVHSHVHHFSGFTLLLAHIAGVQTRIAHSHSDTSLNDGRAGLWRKTYLRATEWLIHHHATTGLACSSLAAISLFGKSWESDTLRRILHCGVDLEPFMIPVDRAEVRRELDIPVEAFVLGHVGRFVEPKNHDFLLDIFAEVVRREPNAYLLLVGDGPLRETIVQKTQRLGLMDKVIFAGVRPDIPRLMLGAMDVFVFPSLYEGLGLVIIEAQAANLHCVYSESITEEVGVLHPLIHRVSIEKSVSVWTDIVFDVRGCSSLPQRQVSDVVSRSTFNINICLKQLEKVYEP